MSADGFYTKETFDEFLEWRAPPVNIRIVVSAISTKPLETKRRKSAKHSFEFMMRRNVHPRMLENGHFCRTFNETDEMCFE